MIGTVVGWYFNLFPQPTQMNAPPSWIFVVAIIGFLLLMSNIAPWIIRVIRGKDVEFFPNRSILQKTHGTISERLKNIDHADAIWVLGQKFYHAAGDTHKVHRLLLPNPGSETLKFLVSTGHNWTKEETLKEITELAKTAGAEVKWYDNFISHSIILADTDKRRGWVHIESVLPYSTNEQRPSYTIYRRSQRKAVEEMQRVFNALWDNSTTK